MLVSWVSWFIKLRAARSGSDPWVVMITVLHEVTIISELGLFLKTLNNTPVNMNLNKLQVISNLFDLDFCIKRQLKHKDLQSENIISLVTYNPDYQKGGTLCKM